MNVTKKRMLGANFKRTRGAFPMRTDLGKARLLFWTFFKIGAFTFGGGYAMIPLIQREVAERRRWLKDGDILDIVAIAESTPGPIAINSATFVGYQVCGTFGAFCATLGVVLPSFLIILLVARCYAAFRSSAIVSGVMGGLRPAVIGMIAAAVVSVGATVFLPDGVQAVSAVSLGCSLAIFGGMTVLTFKKVHPIVIILLSALLGIAAGYLLPV